MQCFGMEILRHYQVIFTEWNSHTIVFSTLNLCKIRWNEKFWAISFREAFSRFRHFSSLLKMTILLNSLLMEKYQLKIPVIAWWWLWNFIVRQVKFNLFLHPNEPPQRILWCIVRQLEVEQLKIEHNFTNKFYQILEKLEMILIKHVLLLI